MKWVKHTLEVKAQLNNYLSNMQAAETGQRGFIITGNEKFLKSYNLAIEKLKTSFVPLRNLTMDNTKQQHAINKLQNFSELKKVFMKKNIALRKENGFEAAHTMVSSEMGSVLMDNIRKTISEMLSEENRLLKERTKVTSESLQKTVSLIIAGCILLLTLVGFFMYFIIRDLRTRTRLEKELRIALSRMQELITNLNTGILVESPEHKIVLTNDIFCEIFSIPAKAELPIGTDCSKAAEQVKHLFINPDGFVSDISSLIKKRMKVIGELLFMKNGNIYERDFIPIIVGNEYLGHLWQYKDVTSVKLAKENLRINEERLNFAIESNNEGVWDVDLKADTILLTKRCKEMLGYSEEEIGNSMVLWTKLVHPEDLSSLLEGRNTVIRGEAKSFSNEHRKLCKDGNWKWVQVRGMVATRDNTGNALRMIGTYTDISERRQQQEELQNAKEHAEYLAGAKDQFLASMSHEIRTPLNGIIGFTKILLQNGLTEVQRKQMDAIKTSSDILLVLINDILDLAKIEAGKMTLEETELKVVDFINSISATFELRFEEKGLNVTQQYDKRIPKLLLGDPVRITQILFNLIDNAIKFTEKGGNIGISVNLLEQNEEKAFIEIIVSDTGKGISEDELVHIFEPFVQSSKNIARQYGGTGLGLSIVKRLADLMGGTVSIQSEFKKGTSLTFILPLKKTTATEIASKRIVDNTDKIEWLGKLKVLIVEDNLINQLLAKTILRKFGFETASAENGKIAIDLLEKNNYDIILMDLMMPKMNGWEATQHIRNKMQPPKSTIPIIALSADVTKASLDKCAEVGMDDYLSKPFNQNDLLNKIIQLVNKNKNNGNE